MSSRGTRIVVFVVALAAIAAAGYRLVVLQRQRTAATTAAERMTARTDTLLFTLQELRAAQQAYVAAGQNEQIWTGRVSALLPEAGDRLRDIQQTASATGAASRAAAAATALATFGKADIRARESLRDGQPLMASDLIFSEAREALTTVTAAVDDVRRHEAASARADTDAVDRQQLLAIAGAALVCLVAILLLVPAPRADAAAPGLVEPRAGDDRSLLGRSVEEASAPVAAQTPAPASDDLVALAALCTDLGRLVEGARIGEMLGRTASLTGATGLILWVADRTGQVLHAVAAHGYDAKVLARLGPIPRTAENATAAAYRIAQVHTVPGDGTHNGALVIPLIGPEGCSGVLTAEVPSGDERRESVRAIATVVAAQLATLVTALPTTDSTPQG